MLPGPSAGWGAQVVPDRGREERWQHAGSVAHLGTGRVAPLSRGQEPGTGQGLVRAGGTAHGWGGAHPWVHTAGCHAQQQGAPGILLCEDLRARRRLRAPRVHARGTPRPLGGSRGAEEGTRPCPVLPGEPCAACAAGSGSQRLFWKASCLLPSCLTPLQQLSAPGTLADSSETRPVFLAHIFLLHIALGVTLHRAGNTAAFLRWAAGEVPAPPCQRCAQRIAGRRGGG